MKKNRIRTEKSFSLIFSHFKKLPKIMQILWYIAIIISAIFGTYFAVIDAFIIKDLTNSLQNWNNDSWSNICFCTIKLLVYSSCLFLVDSFYYIVCTYIDNKSTKIIRDKLCKKFDKLEIKYFDQNPSGKILSTITNDATNIGNGCMGSLCDLIINIITIFTVFICMFVVSWYLTLVVISVYIIGFALIFIIMKFSQKYYFTKQQLVGKLNSYAKECIENNVIIQTYNLKDEVNKNFNILNKQTYKISFLQYFSQLSLRVVMVFVNYLVTFLLVTTIAIIILNNPSQIIILTLVPTFLIFFSILTPCCMYLGRTMAQVQTAAGSLTNIYKVLDEKEMEINKNNFNPKKIEGNISFKNVCFSYNNKEQVINDFSLDIKKGQKVAIIGKTGSGKTTLISLLMKFYNINSGKITIDGYDLAKLNQHETAQIFGTVLQDAWLYNDTIKNNIIYNKKHVSKEMFDKACISSNIHHFIKTLPEGENTMITPTINFSQGQKQLLTIARQIVKNSPILILDEATSNIDSEYEYKIQHSMDKLMKGKTSIIIAHRLSTIVNADIIVVLKDGKIIEQGSHKKLLAKRGEYYFLYNNQFTDETN